MTKTCSICEQELDPNSPSGPAHARQHKNEFQRIMGRRPRDYDEVRELLCEDGSIDVLTLEGYQ